MQGRGWTFPDSDIRFLIEAVLPERSDKNHLVELVRDDETFIESMLGHRLAFERVMAEETVMLYITPQLFFHVLLRQARKDLQQETYTVELRARQKIPIFDSHQVVELLGDAGMRSYLADMLASFTRVHSFTWPVRVRRGIWHKHRFSDLDVDSLIKLCQSVEEEQRFAVYKRIADVCLLIAGMFPEYAQPGAMVARTRRGERDLEDYEQEGRQFYQLAAHHEGAAILDLRDVLHELAERFTLAEKPLKFLSEHYLLTRKHTLFAAPGVV